MSGDLAALDRRLNTLRLGLSTLDERVRSVGTILAHPDLRGYRSDERTRMAFKRVLRLLVQRLELQRIDRERFCVAPALYELDGLIRELGSGGSGYFLILTKPIPTGYNPRSQHRLVEAQ